jgi:hypothetical protein
MCTWNAFHLGDCWTVAPWSHAPRGWHTRPGWEERPYRRSLVQKLSEMAFRQMLHALSCGRLWTGQSFVEDTGIGFNPSLAFRSMQSPVRELISLSKVICSHSRHRFRLFKVDQASWRSRNPFMRQASCCRCSSRSWIPGIISCAEQWRRKVWVESSHTLSR